MKQDLSLLQKLEIGRRWENVRLAYFIRDGDNKKIKELTAKLQTIEKEIYIGNYH